MNASVQELLAQPQSSASQQHGSPESFSHQPSLRVSAAPTLPQSNATHGHSTVEAGDCHAMVNGKIVIVEEVQSLESTTNGTNEYLFVCMCLVKVIVKFLC